VPQKCGDELKGRIEREIDDLSADTDEFKSRRLRIERPTRTLDKLNSLSARDSGLWIKWLSADRGSQIARVIAEILDLDEGDQLGYRT
jgi:hypothetical protein